MRVQLSPFVGPDLEEIGDYIAQDNPERAVSFIREIRAKFAAIGQAPQLYRLRPEIAEDARVATVGRYVILFRIAGETVRIERVAYGGRLLDELFREGLP